MIEVEGAGMQTVGRLTCECCYTGCGRFPYLLMLKGMGKPVTVCKSCYRTALVIQWLKNHGGFEIVEVKP